MNDEQPLRASTRPEAHLKRTKQNEAEDSKVFKIARLAPDHESLVDSSVRIELQEARLPKWSTPPENNLDPWLSNEGESSHAADQTARDNTKFSDSVQSLDEVKTGNSLLKVASINTGSSVTEGAELSPEICLGMIFGAKATYVDGASLDENCFKNVLIGDSQYIRLKLLLKKNCHFLCFDFSDVGIAVLDARTSAVLQKIEAICPTEFCVFKDDSPAISIDQQRDQKFSGRHMLYLVIDVYSPKRFAKAIGKELSKARFYLQPPYRLDKSRLYENPHEFKSKRLAIRNIFGKPEDSSQQSLPYIQAPTVDLPNEERQASLVEQLLQTQVQNQAILQSDPDSRITTNLLLHQKQALYFILQRERGIINSGLSLWKTEGTQQRPYYRHSIHDYRTAKLPEDNRGGLLADEMGLGKTLSLISAIVMSLDDAKTYSYPREKKKRVDATRKSQATLVIAPSTVLLDGWLAEIKSHVLEGTLNAYLYHGQGRQSDVEHLLDYDIVLTTYATISTEHSRASPPLQQLEWFRIVLDEAHFIRNPSTKQFQAVCMLKAQRRWCLSGTPVQNSLEDLGSLLQFLRVPFLKRKADFKRHVISPLLTGKPDSALNLRLLLNAICLRRMMSLLKLPETRYQTQRVTQSPEERNLYDEILQKSREEIEFAVSSKNSETAYVSILRAILRTRMLCDQGTFLNIATKSRLASSLIDNGNILAELQEGDRGLDQLSPHLTSKRDDPWQMDIDTPHHTSHDLLLPSSATTQHGHSTKLMALVKNLRSEEPEVKSIVFSCWKTTLDLVEPLLRSKNLTFIRIDGNVSGSARACLVDKFHTDPKIKIILMTTGTGAVGLNLTIATQVHILEPQWNPSIESQAIGRALRLTQKNVVTVTRYITENTIEEQVQERQSKKLELAELTLNRDMGSEDQLSQRLQNLRSLLRM